MSNKRSVLITGASRGLGLALTKQFLDEDWRVYPLVRKTSDASKLKDLNQDDCIPIITDITGNNVLLDIKKALINSNQIDVVINNAGIAGDGKTLATTSADEILALLNVHCLGVLRVTQAIMPYMINNGFILNISSRFGSIRKVASGELDGIKCSYSYRIAKAAQNMLTQCIKQEYQNSGIKICSIHPGRLKTELAASDAEILPEQAAVEIVRLVIENKIVNGKYYSLFEGELDW